MASGVTCNEHEIVMELQQQYWGKSQEGYYSWYSQEKRCKTKLEVIRAMLKARKQVQEALPARARG